ncbi:hypothetical protein ACOMHN_045807 [Nucella lapillus]
MHGPAHVEKIQGGVAIHVVDVQTTLFISMGGRKIVMPVSHEKLNKLFCCHVFSDVNIVNNSWRSTKRIVERHIFVYYRSSRVTVTFTTIGVLIATHLCLKFHRHLHRCKTQQW